MPELDEVINDDNEETGQANGTERSPELAPAVDVRPKVDEIASPSGDQMIPDTAQPSRDEEFAQPQAAMTAEQEEEAIRAPAVAAPESDAVEAKKTDPAHAERSTVGQIDPEKVDMPWYVVHTYSGFEQHAKLSLEERIRTRNLEDKFGAILIPQETVIELVRGKKKTSTRKFLPGYLLIQAKLDEDTWHLVRETPKITGFVGDSTSPSPISKEEVQNLLKQMEGGAQKPRSRVHFEKGDAVKVVDGPFSDFNGTVDEVKPDKGKLRVLISIFGRNTPVELDFVQVEKA